MTGSDKVSVTSLDRTTVSPVGPLTAENKALRKYFRVNKGSGITAFATDSLVLTYTNADVIEQGVGKDTLQVFKNDGNFWARASILRKDTSANTMTITGVMSFSDFVIAGANIPGSPIFSTQASGIDFGMIDIKNLVVDTMYVKNTGNEALTISNVTVTDTNFAFQRSRVGPLAPGDSTAFRFTYDPKVSGTKSAYAIFSSNDVGSPDSIALVGRAQYPVFAPSRASVSFGDVPLNVSQKDSVLVKNTSTVATLNISATASSNALFTITPMIKTLVPLDSAKFYITFIPADGTVQNGYVLFTHDGANGMEAWRCWLSPPLPPATNSLL